MAAIGQQSDVVILREVTIVIGWSAVSSDMFGAKAVTVCWGMDPKYDSTSLLFLQYIHLG